MARVTVTIDVDKFRSTPLLDRYSVCTNIHSQEIDHRLTILIVDHGKRDKCTTIHTTSVFVYFCSICKLCLLYSKTVYHIRLTL